MFFPVDKDDLLVRRRTPASSFHVRSDRSDVYHDNDQLGSNLNTTLDSLYKRQYKKFLARDYEIKTLRQSATEHRHSPNQHRFRDRGCYKPGSTFLPPATKTNASSQLPLPPKIAKRLRVPPIDTSDTISELSEESELISDRDVFPDIIQRPATYTGANLIVRNPTHGTKNGGEVVPPRTGAISLTPQFKRRPTKINATLPQPSRKDELYKLSQTPSLPTPKLLGDIATQKRKKKFPDAWYTSVVPAIDVPFRKKPTSRETPLRPSPSLKMNTPRFESRTEDETWSPYGRKSDDMSHMTPNSSPRNNGLSVRQLKEIAANDWAQEPDYAEIRRAEILAANKAHSMEVQGKVKTFIKSLDDMKQKSIESAKRRSNILEKLQFHENHLVVY